MQREHELFELGQKALIIRSGKCLLLETSDHPGCWEFPGGRLEKGEDIGEAFQRELEEEVGFKHNTFEELIDCGIVSKNNGTKIFLVARKVTNNMDEVCISNEHTSFQWVSLASLDAVNFLWPEHRE